ncbi:hypothetical protein, partial [Vibrio cholerae]|uniref:hypothetical protein n=1 Tax=Vibrio cholerae TaxID=666 RepID=UPI001C118F43
QRLLAFGKAQAQQTQALGWVLVEHRHRNGRHAMFAGHPQGHGDVIQVWAYLRVIHQLEVSAGHPGKTQA